MPKRRRDSAERIAAHELQARPAAAAAAGSSEPSARRGPAAEAGWQLVSVVETVPVGSVLDLLLRREQTAVLLELAALAAQLERR